MYKFISRFPIRYLGGQKAVGQYIQSTKGGRKKHCQPRILYLAKLSKSEIEIKTFQDEQKL